MCPRNTEGSTWAVKGASDGRRGVLWGLAALGEARWVWGCVVFIACFCVWGERPRVASAGDVLVERGEAVEGGQRVRARGTSARSKLVLVAGGDVAYPKGVKEQALAAQAHTLFDELSPWIKASDLAFLNLETPLTARRAVMARRWPIVTDPARLDWLLQAGFNLFSLANNHTHDAGDQGVADTLAAMEAARARGHEIWWAGAARHRDDAYQVTLVRPEGKDVTVAFVAFGEGRTPLVPRPSTSEALELIAQAAALADIVVVSAHSGREYEHVPRAHRAALFRSYIDVGADVVLGHHPHVVQGVEAYKDGVIFHSLGNLSFASRSIRYMSKGARLFGMFPIIEFERGRLRRVEVIPLFVNNVEPWTLGGQTLEPLLARPQRLHGPFAHHVLDELARWTAAVPGISPEAVAALQRVGERLVIDWPGLWGDDARWRQGAREGCAKWARRSLPWHTTRRVPCPMWRREIFER